MHNRRNTKQVGRQRATPSAADRRRALTIARLVADIETRTGRSPTNAELATLLARSPNAIARLRRLIDGRAP